MVLPVRRRIHCGIGRFCFCALASFCLVRKDLWLLGTVSRLSESGSTFKSFPYRHLDGVPRIVEDCRNDVGADGLGI